LNYSYFYSLQQRNHGVDSIQNNASEYAETIDPPRHTASAE
jgi:hypothetical protein